MSVLLKSLCNKEFGEVMTDNDSKYVVENFGTIGMK